MPTPSPPTVRVASTSPSRAASRWVRQDCKLTEAEYGALSLLKKRAAALARPMKRGELLRVGLQMLAHLDDAALFEALDGALLPRR